MPEKTPKAGKYVLVADRWDRITSKPGQPFTYDRFVRGDIVELSAEEAERLAKVVEKPGESQARKAAQLKAQAEALDEQSRQMQARAADVTKAAKQS